MEARSAPSEPDAWLDRASVFSPAVSSGIEQDWTIERKPGGNGALRIVLEVSDGFEARIDDRGGGSSSSHGRGQYSRCLMGGPKKA